MKSDLKATALAICFLTLMAIACCSVNAEETKTTEEATEKQDVGLTMIAAGLAIGLSAMGAGYAIAATGSAAIGATAEKPEMFGKVLLFVALGEAIAIYGIVIAFMILG